MNAPKLTDIELKIMRELWEKGPASIRQLLESYPAKRRPAYTTVQTVVYRLEGKGALRRTRKIGGAHIFEAVVSRQMAQRKLVDELFNLFGGRTELLMSHLIETGKLTADDVDTAKRLIDEFESGSSKTSSQE